MPSLPDAYPALTEALAGQYGRPSGATAGGGAFERIVAAVLGASGPALAAALREEGLLEPAALAEADPAEIEQAMAGRGKGRPGAPAIGLLRKLARWVVEHHGGDPGELDAAATSSLREELVALRGIGGATADAILLQGLGRAAYPVDRATYRILARHGWIDPTADYDEARAAVLGLDPDDPDAMARLSSWFERVGREYCRAGAPRCERCPLRPFLPDGGPLEPDVS